MNFASDGWYRCCKLLSLYHYVHKKIDEIYACLFRQASNIRKQSGYAARILFKKIELCAPKIRFGNVNCRIDCVYLRLHFIIVIVQNVYGAFPNCPKR